MIVTRPIPARPATEVRDHRVAPPAYRTAPWPADDTPQPPCTLSDPGATRGRSAIGRPDGLLARIAIGPIDPRQPDRFGRVLAGVLGLLVAAGAAMAVTS